MQIQDILFKEKKKGILVKHHLSMMLEYQEGKNYNGITIVNLLLNLGNLAFLIKRIKSSLP